MCSHNVTNTKRLVNTVSIPMLPKTVQSKRIDAKQLITHRFRLDQVLPADAILQEAKSAGCDLIVIGTHGRRGFRRALLGSDAESVLRESPVPVLLVRAPSARS